MHEVLHLPAVDVVQALRRGELDPLSLLDAVEERLGEVEPTLNAVVTTCLERARQRARDIMAGTGPGEPDHRAWLGGLPVTVKDTVDVAGMPTTFGSLPFKNATAATSAPLVQHLERRGALIVGKTNVPEFCSGADTANAVFGRTVNPHDAGASCGASSGGAAVSVAAHEVWCAHGEDTGGSIRIPAAFCAVVGLRPTPGLIPSSPGATDDVLMVDGPLARSVADARLFFEAMVGSDRTGIAAADRRQPRPLRVAFTTDYDGTIPVHPQVAAACEQVVRRLPEPQFLVEAHSPSISGVHDACTTLFANRAVQRHGDHVAKLGDQLGFLILSEVATGLSLTREQVSAAWQAREAFQRSMHEFFTRYDVLITPTIGCPPWRVSPDAPLGLPELSQLEGVLAVWPLTTVATMAGCPAVSVPCGWTSAGEPLAIQVLTAPLADHVALDVAEVLESLAGRTVPSRQPSPTVTLPTPAGLP